MTESKSESETATKSETKNGTKTETKATRGFEEFVNRAKRYVENYIRHPSNETLTIAVEELQHYDSMHMQVFQIRLLIPLMVKLDNMNCENMEVQTGIIRLMKMVITRSFLKDLKAIKTLLLVLLKQIRDFEKATLKPNLSEEIKLETIECIQQIYQRTITEVLLEYFVPESALLLGQILLTAVEFIAFEKYRKLRISSINCLMAIFYCHDDADDHDIVLRSQIAETLFLYVPKIITELIKASLSDEKVGETLISTAIRALGRILHVMLQDTQKGSLPKYDSKSFKDLVAKSQQPLTSPQTNDFFNKSTEKSKPKLEEHVKKLQSNGRTEEWFVATATKLNQLLPKLAILRANQSRQIRFEYSMLCCQLITRCSSKLGDNNIELLESIMAMSNDEDADIRKLCSQTLLSIQNSECGIIFDDLYDILFDRHLAKLPRIISRCEEKEQYSELLFLKGFFQNISDRRLKLLFSFSKNLEEFSKCLILAFEMQMQTGLLNEEYALRDICEDEYVLHTNHWRKLKNLESERVFSVVCDICRSLARPETCNVLYDHLMELFRLTGEVVNEVLLICGLLLSCKARLQRRETVKSFLNELFEESHWHLALHPDETKRLKVKKKSDWFVDRTPGLYESAIEVRVQDVNSDDSDDDEGFPESVTIADAQLNVLHTCIVLDALGNIALAMEDNFKPFVFQAIHKVLLKAGSSNYNVYLCGSYALSAMRKALGFKKIHELLDEYTDYISFHMITLLKRPSESRSACDILSVVLRYSSINSLAYIESLFAVMQEECSKVHQNINVTSYLKVYHVFFSNVSKWTARLNEIGETTDVQEDEIQMEEEVDPYRKWMEILNKPRHEEVEIDFEEPKEQQEEKETQNRDQENEQEEPERNEEDAKPELPGYIKLINEMLVQVVKFVSSQDKTQQIVALECLISGLPLLKDYENQLLPLVHQIWQPFVERVKEKDPIVLYRCFALLEALAVHAKDFILRRSLKEVLPFLVGFLTSSASGSKYEHSLAATQEFKLQSKLLKEFATLIVNMEIGGKHFNSISQAVVLYLSNKQPSSLQLLAVEFFKELRTYNGPFVYIVVLKYKNALEFMDNVKLVLDAFEVR